MALVEFGQARQVMKGAAIPVSTNLVKRKIQQGSEEHRFLFFLLVISVQRPSDSASILSYHLFAVFGKGTIGIHILAPGATGELVCKYEWAYFCSKRSLVKQYLTKLSTSVKFFPIQSFFVHVTETAQNIFSILANL